MRHNDLQRVLYTPNRPQKGIDSGVHIWNQMSPWIQTGKGDGHLFK